MLITKTFKNRRRLQIALARLEEIFDAKKRSAEGDELEVLATLIEKYEDENFPIEVSKEVKQS